MLSSLGRLTAVEMIEFHNNEGSVPQPIPEERSHSASDRSGEDTMEFDFRHKDLKQLMKKTDANKQ